MKPRLMDILDTVAALAGDREPPGALCFAPEAYERAYAEYLKQQPQPPHLPEQVQYIPLFSVIAEEGVPDDALDTQLYPHHELIRKGEPVNGEYILYLHEGDVLTPDALHTLAVALDRARGSDFIYADEDRLSGGQRHSPSFKPEFSLFTLLSYNYIGRPLTVSRTLHEASGGLSGPGPELEYAYALRCAGACKHPLHVPQVLCSCAKLSPPPQPERMRKILDTFLQGRDAQAFSANGLWAGSSRMRRNLQKDPPITVILPNRDHADRLRRFLERLDDTVLYLNYRVCIVDAASSDAKTLRYYALLKKNKAAKVVRGRVAATSYAALCNRGAKPVRAGLLLFMTPDTLPASDGWMYALAELASTSGIGAAGPKITDGQGYILEAGRALVSEDRVQSERIYAGAEDEVYELLKNRSINTIRAVQALGSGCLMFSSAAFHACGGFDETLAQEDAVTDLCLRLAAMGLACVYTPFAQCTREEPPQ